MKNPFNSKDIADSTRRRVELAIAVAQERLLATHVDHALNLIQLVGGEVPFENSLAIYTRLLRLSDDESRVITTRALAILGERAAETSSWPELITQAEIKQADESGRRNFMDTVRHRLRGRVNDELRRFVELAAARTEIAILNTHVENALNFVEMLEPDLSITEATEMYLEALEVRESISEVAYYLTLTRLADEKLPKIEAPPEEPPSPRMRRAAS
ncbi:MAG: hypothetical protein ACREMA_04350 [Longimicrobiales bacterium]